MFEATLPTMPRLLTALAEWMSCTVMLLLVERRFTVKITAVLCLVFGAVIVQFNYYADAVTHNMAFSEQERFYLWMAGMVFCVLVLFIYIIVCSAGSISTAVGCWAIAFAAAEFMASAEWQASSALLESRSMKNAGVFLLMLFLFALMLAGGYIAEKKIYDSFIRLDWKQSVLLAVMVAVSMVIGNVGFQKIEWKNQADLQMTLSSIRTLVDFGTLVSMYLVQRMHREHEMQMEMASIHHMLNLQYQQYRDFKVNSEYISRQCHDLKHQIEALRKACTEDEREQSLQEMEAAVQNYDAQNVTGSPVLDAILTQKKLLCARNHIQFTCMADGRSLGQVSVRDISIIIGNLIDNAIECVIQYQEEDRVIEGEIYQKNSFLMIKFRNYFCGELLYEKGLPVTTKADQADHGYGLKSVRYTVEKYHGTMTVSSENSCFFVKILLPV